MSNCCPPKEPEHKSSCCETESQKASFDWMLWGSLSLVVVGYLLHLSGAGHTVGVGGGAEGTQLPAWLATMSHGIYELINTMWWGVLAAFVFVGVLSKIPQEMVTSILGKGGSFNGVFRATMAGVLMDLCSHGILMVGMKLYERGASLGQVMAFLIASPWNSLSLTIILIALIGFPWTLAFIVLSMLIALISGWLFDGFVHRGVLPANPHTKELDDNYRLWPHVKEQLGQTEWNGKLLSELIKAGVSGSRIVIRWLLFGVVLATALRSFVSLDDFQTWFGPTALGLVVTLVAATIIEVCSEGSAPIAADLMTRAEAPGNSFAFLMTGVSTDYTEIMVLKDTTRSWKIALFLPLVTVPQVVILALILNTF